MKWLQNKASNMGKYVKSRNDIYEHTFAMLKLFIIFHVQKYVKFKENRVITYVLM